MLSNIGFEFAVKTDTGLVRPHNEDAVVVSPASGIAVLADGMGGYNAGEVASRIAVDMAMQTLEEGLARLRERPATRIPWSKPLHQLLTDAIRRANAAIQQAAAETPAYHGMGTTVVAAVLQQEAITIAHVGDSRAYRLRNGVLTQLTRDHSLLQEQIDAGLITPEAAMYAPNKNLLTRALGIEPDVAIDVHDYRMQPGDLYLLCSDGLTDMLRPDEMRDLLITHQASLDAAAEMLVRRANEHGGHDNISVILLRVPASDAEASGLLGRIFSWIG
jgi:protein phosphatase